VALSPETKKFHEEREELRRQAESPTPEEKEAEAQYWCENPNLFGHAKGEAKVDPRLQTLL
jgi:hypothetical protein